MYYDYNPFEKDFDSITVEDLAVLSSVAEGWYVEYKQEVPNAGAVAKSITAFANTYGGWIFYGVTERSKEEPVAGSFPGIANNEADGCLQRIRQAVANHAQPAPYFRVRALFGPLETIGLPAGRCIIIGQIPWGPEAPYIHKDGRIYRRVGDGSEPRPENDRFILDQLWSRASKITQQYEEWINQELETSKAEENAAYARIFLIANFWGDHEAMKPVSLKRVREIMADASGGISIPFDNVYNSSSGFVCRQTASNNPEQLGLTWKLSPGFESEIIIPLSKFRCDRISDLTPWLHGYEHAGRFLQLCHMQRYHRPSIIDLNILFHILLGVMRTQALLAREFGWAGPIYAKIEVSGVWRTVPFIDVLHVLDEYEKHGIALGLSNTVLLYRGTGQGSFIELPGIDVNSEGDRCWVQMATCLFLHIATALGVPMSTDPDGDGADAGASIGSFLEAGKRAIEVQGNRAQLT